jgi:hypothetical protein
MNDKLAFIEDLVLRQPGQKMSTTLKITREKRAGSMAQAVEHLVQTSVPTNKMKHYYVSFCYYHMCFAGCF